MQLKEFKDLTLEAIKEVESQNRIWIFGGDIRSYYFIENTLKRVRKALEHVRIRNFEWKRFESEFLYTLKSKFISNELKVKILELYFKNSFTDMQLEVTFIRKFLKSYQKGFKLENFNKEDEDLINYFIHISIEILNYLINLAKKNQANKLIIQLYTIILRKIFYLVTINHLEPKKFEKFFIFYEYFSIYYHPLEKWKLLIDFYYDIIKSKSKTKEIIFQFLNYIGKDLRLLNPSKARFNPINFCEYLEKKLNEKEIKQVYYDYYENNVTNFIPPLFLKRSSLRNKKILDIIKKNLLNQLFERKDYDKLFDNLINSNPKKDLFNTYKKVIASLFNQYKSFRYSDLFCSRAFTLYEKFQIVKQIFIFFPDSDEFPQIAYKYIFKKNILIQKEKVLISYFDYILTSENYEEFRRFVQIINKNPEYVIDTNMMAKKYSLNRRINKIRILTKKIFNQLKFSRLKNLRFLIEDERSRFDRKYDLEKFALNRFNSDSYELIRFLYFLSVKKAVKTKSWNVAIKYSEKYADYKLRVKKEANIESSERRIKDYELELNTFRSLIHSEKEKKLRDFIDKKLEIETKDIGKDYIKMGILNLFLGKINNTKEILLTGKEALKTPHFFFNHSYYNYIRKEKREKINLLFEIVEFEENIRDFDSIKEIKIELINLLDKISKMFYQTIGYFYVIEIYIHYRNLLCFFQLLELLNNPKSNKKDLSILLDMMVDRGNYCPQWRKIILIWKDILKAEPLYENIQIYAEDMQLIFKKNLVLKRIYEFIQKISQRSIYLNKLFFPKFKITERELENLELIIENNIFWKSFIVYTINNSESLYWDCKKIFQFWKVPNKKKKAKKGAQIKACSNIISFANSEGGIIFLGISDELPRKIKGIKNIEAKKNSIIDLLNKYTNNLAHLIKFHEFTYSNGRDSSKILILIIPQSKEVVELKLDNINYRIPVRIGAKTDYKNYQDLNARKSSIEENNIKFIKKLSNLINL